ncbi:glycoside hydrolase family 3 N-terminal domain-containing protein [Schumannella luteola]|uniref:Beta-glucosidase n=1 Tax=Schumannella luteola TaxID=472059 RepID=A0A852Y932_9MICO|nr:glycoside hydrolase family 3 N-terminal domain-containing protein [Schumannella luteola]NYG98372.1 beta-glucosidase [Schumannella luteola]
MSETLRHLDARLPAEERARELLALMTVREKAFQLTSAAPWNFVHTDGARSATADDYVTRGYGFICNFGVDDPTAMATVVGRLQRIVVEETRLGIPLLVQAEALSGFLSGGHMVFPTPTGLAATWSPELVESMTDTIRTQMRRVGVRHALSPNLDVALDPRWGRVHETFGEDPYLVAAMGVGFVRGLQGPDRADGVIATGKHFIGYGEPQGGINLSAFEGGRRRIRDLYAFPFEAAIRTAGLASVMNSYSDVDGVPAGASREILTDLLRGELGFTGFVSADYGTIEQLVHRQKVARTAGDAGALALHAGLDTEFPVPFGYGDTLAAEVDAGRVDIADLDQAVTRILIAKFQLGLFENPYPAETIDVAAVAAEGAEVSRELARRSIVLLENDGILPVADDLSIAIVGPHADDVINQFATYSYPAFRDMMVHMSSGGMGNMIGVDPAMATWNAEAFATGGPEDYARDRLGARTLGEVLGERRDDVVVERGCSITGEMDDPTAFDRAVAAAAAADVVILALGGASLWFNGERTEGEGSDSADIALPAVQTRLADAVAALDTPRVTVLVQGRAYVLPASVLSSNALIVAPYGGPFGAAAVADVLLGDVNPSGRLPYSIPRVAGQTPVHHHQRTGTGRRNPLPPDVDRHYLDAAATPQYGFAAGGSYTEFTLGETVAGELMSTRGSVPVTTVVENTGSRAGAVVVQLYLSAPGVGVTRPAQQLAGFARVDLAAGERATVQIDLAADQLAYTGADGVLAVEPGEVDVWFALDSEEGPERQRVTVHGDRRPVSGAARRFLSRTSVS